MNLRRLIKRRRRAHSVESCHCHRAVQDLIVLVRRHQGDLQDLLLTLQHLTDAFSELNSEVAELWRCSDDRR